MDTVLPIFLLMFLVCFVGNTNGTRCYYCASDCFDPFNKTNPNAISMASPSGWCMKFKTSVMRESIITRSFAPFGLCTRNECKSVHHNDLERTACCCNTDLCNNSNKIAKSLSSFTGLAFIAGMNIILNY